MNIKSTLKLSVKSFRFRKQSLLLSLVSLTLSVVLILSIEQIQKSVQSNLTQSISQVDLIVGARGSTLSLLLYSVFNIGSATNNVTYSSYQKISKDPRIDWTIPYSLGDGHRGFRVVATNDNFFKHYRFKKEFSVEFHQGRFNNQLQEVVIGFEVYKELKYQIEQQIVISHGSTTGDSFIDHADRPFTITGILKPTGTAIDRSLYISLESMEVLHISPEDFIQIKNSVDATEKLTPQAITSFFLRSKNRIQTLSLQRDINTFVDEPLSAAIPGVVLNELWQMLKPVDIAMRSIISLVALVSLFSLLSVVLTLLNERKKEMNILRSLGAPSIMIMSLMALEGFLVSVFAVILGYGTVFFSNVFLEEFLLNQFGFRLSAGLFTTFGVSYSVAVIVAGTLVSLIPALYIYKKSVSRY